ncbi:proteasome assembly chaperone family protein [Halosimplex pelagicum]|uniref:Proteasome assembly chaperone family protein n=1 Tax=Halosimplex pelagicum TaxID=869886 RepID=A0A7D5P8K4_9EURY|nr:PAC2 family protein [Halosimplex pelagicum]QLH83486.1 proteasome assembly chaperone family protein [Halosimplex pelagicum]
MEPQSTANPTFEIHDTGDTGGEALIAGFSEFGLAGLTAVDYLVQQLGLEPVGHVTAPDLPTITPFDEGAPRHPVRLFSADSVPVVVLVSELFVPATGARSFSDALLSWTADADISETVVLSGVQMPHAEEDHRTFYVATDDYRRARLEDADVPPMATGFTDGVKASVLARGIDSPLRACVYATPAHAQPQAPDAEAALRLVETVDDVYDLGVDTGPMESFASDIQRHYQDLAERIEQAREEQQPEDRMYM